jgi:hypothetical protein
MATAGEANTIAAKMIEDISMMKRVNKPRKRHLKRVWI